MNDFEGLTDPPADLPPWEQQGAVRRDCASHRGGALARLGQTACLVGSISLCCLPGLLVSLPLGLAVWLVAHRDLREMAQGRMDPAGRQQAWQAVADGQFAFWMSLIWITVVLGATLAQMWLFGY